MKCEDAQLSFSRRFDGELLSEELERHEEHCALCPTCAEAWSGFERSTRALRGLGVSPVSGDYVDSVVAVATGAPAAAHGQRRRLRPVASHLVALLAGAALVLLLLRLGVFDESRPAPEERRELVAEVGTSPSEPTEPVEPRVEIVEPRVEIVERPVRHVEYVVLPALEVPARPDPELQRSLRFMGESFLALCESIARQPALVANAAPAVKVPVSAAPLQPLQVRLRPSLSAFVPAAAVAIRRHGDVLSLETHGSLDEVVPALIARIDDEDGQVGELVQRRLREIWAERTGQDVNTAPFAVASEDEAQPRFGWRRWLDDAPAAAEAPDPAESWSRWWAEERALVVRAGM